MLFWIDATQPGSDTEIFGLSLVERQIRIVRDICDLNALTEGNISKLSELAPQLAADLKRTVIPDRTSEIRVELPENARIPNIKTTLGAHITMTWSTSGKSLGERLSSAVNDANGSAVICMSGDTEVDGRLITHLAGRQKNNVFYAGEGEGRCTAFRVSNEIPVIDASVTTMVGLADVLIELGAAKEMNPQKFNGYIPKLRRTLAPYIFKISSDQIVDEVERFLFHSNYKGATDFMTKHVYPPLVWRMVHPLAKWRVKPNTITIISIIATFGAIPLFAAAAWVPGMILAFAMSVLDSVDGKLARVTFTSSPQGNLLDHGTDLIHPPFWYFGWAWGLSGGDPFSPVFQASIWSMGIYVFDRMLERLFKVCTGRSIQDFRPIDVKLRTFVSRRNVNLAIFVVALPLGVGIEAFYAIVGWQALTAIYHFVRVLQFWDGNPDEGYSIEEGDDGFETSGDLSDFEAMN